GAPCSESTTTVDNFILNSRPGPRGQGVFLVLEPREWLKWVTPKEASALKSLIQRYSAVGIAFRTMDELEGSESVKAFVKAPASVSRARATGKSSSKLIRCFYNLVPHEFLSIERFKNRCRDCPISLDRRQPKTV